MNYLPRNSDVESQLSEVRHDVLTEIKRVRSPRRSTQFRVIRALALGLTATIALTAGALVIVRATQEQINYSVVCYSGETLGSQTVTVESPPVVDASDGKGTRLRADPISTCGNMWRMGIVGQDDSPEDPNTAQFPVPDIVGCEQADGVAAGFPREFRSITDEYFCARVGMKVWKS
ncbi:hypothetical protein EYE40_04525 [Glaciihabitans arcticus]|uniref:Uncharacterized protein n=1 Tax=Glaciihabitans arcticus TaxID=2668039 RepID=A0A4Q9GVN3_9MICO|nr:hypothetical protein [Glaciihabitans arcticus]TBN56723.1 hypothetical protein EYE40_04525 [Glaciihabitans arcticus]